MSWYKKRWSLSYRLVRKWAAVIILGRPSLFESLATAKRCQEQTYLYYVTHRRRTPDTQSNTNTTKTVLYTSQSHRFQWCVPYFYFTNHYFVRVSVVISFFCSLFDCVSACAAPVCDMEITFSTPIGCRWGTEWAQWITLLKIRTVQHALCVILPCPQTVGWKKNLAQETLVEVQTNNVASSEEAHHHIQSVETQVSNWKVTCPPRADTNEK